MKKRFGLDRVVPFVAIHELEAMNTRQLLARLQRLRFCEDIAKGSDLTPEEIDSVTGILFKESQEWTDAFTDVKAVLAKREHVPD